MVDALSRDDLYGVLGIERDAAPAAIRSAYRAKSRKAHPDAGGSATAFATLKRAHDVLMDPKKRAIFDETGQVDETLDKSREIMVKEIVEALDNVLVKMLSKGTRPQAQNMIEHLRAYIRQKRDALGKEIAGAEIALASMREMESRFHRDKGENFLGDVVRARCVGMVEHLKSQRALAEILISADELVAGHSFDIEQVRSYGIVWNSTATMT